MDQIDALRVINDAQTERMRLMGERLGLLRDIELEGAGDIAVMGVWIETLMGRKCAYMENHECCAILAIEKLNEAYERVAARRKKKEKIFVEDTQH